MIRAISSAACVLALHGCYFTRSPSWPLQALRFDDPGADATGCLVVFMPGFLDGPDTFREHGLPRALSRSGTRCDSVALDLHYRYYGNGDVADRVYEDILAPAEARGYTEIWLVGVSMGGLGALTTAARYPAHIDGILLMAPFLGEEPVLRTIDAAGSEWQPRASLSAEPWTQSNYTEKLWAWLIGYRTDAAARPDLYLGWGDADRLGPADRILGELLPEGHVVTRPGGHNWATWRPIFDELLLRAPVGANARER